MTSATSGEPAGDSLTTLTNELQLALQLADAADSVTLPRFEKADFTLGWKNDRTEVTEADRETESVLSRIVVDERPDHAFEGEEHGVVGRVDSPWRWLVDPIDGTSGFVRGIPVWATLISLVHADHGPVVGVCSAPALGKRWWAAHGLGSYADGRVCRVSTVERLADAQVSVTYNKGWDDLGLAQELFAIGREAHRVRGFGDFWQHCLVAEGAVDAAVDAIGVQPYDLAAVAVIVREAGGRFTDRFGRHTSDGPSAISSNGPLHDEFVTRLGTNS